MTSQASAAVPSASNSALPEAAPAHWAGVFAMTLCVFALIASEFMPVSLLTPLASDLNITEGMAGQGISISAAFAVITSLIVGTLTRGVNRKTVLLCLTGVMLTSGAVITLAPNFYVYMIGRALIGLVVGGFWSMSAAVAMRLVPAALVPRALAIFNGGNALATVVAAPMGSYLGSAIGWRGAFFCLVPVAFIALAWQWISLPDMQPEQSRAANPLSLMKRPVVVWGMAAVGTFFMGQFALFTFVRPFLESTTQVDLSSLVLIMLTIGVAGFIGTTLSGVFLKWSFYGALVATPLLMAAIAAALAVFGANVWAATTLLGAWGLLATAAPVGWWSWIAKTMPKDAEAGGGLMVAVVQLSIALGSAGGGLLFDAVGYRGAFYLSAVTLLSAGLLTFLTRRMNNNRGS